MNIIHFTHGKVNPEGGSGISRVVYTLNKHEKLMGHDSKILSVVDGIKKHETYIRDEFVTVEMFPRISFFSKKNPIFDYIKINSEKIDIVHIHHMWFWDKNPIIDLCNKLKIPTVMTVHGNYAQYSFDWKKKAAWLLYEKKYSKLVCAYRLLCREELSTIRDLGIEAPAFGNANGISTEALHRFECPKIISQNQNKIVLVNIGRMIEGKNQFSIIKAMNLLSDKNREKTMLLLIGDGDERYMRKIRNYVHSNSLENCIRLLGPIYGKEKWGYLQHANAFIQASLSEGMSIAIAEAVSQGMPCILTRQNNVSYYYDSKFFIMCEPYADDIARAITEFCEHEKNHAKMGENARDFAESKLSHEAVTNKMLQIYTKVINNEQF